MKKIVTINYDAQVVYSILKYNFDVIVHCYDNNAMYEVEGRKAPHVICDWNGGSASIPIWHMTPESIKKLLEEASEDSCKKVLAYRQAQA